MFDKISEFVEKGLGISLTDFLIQLTATLILFLAVKYFLWKPITNLLEQRRAIAMKELEDALDKNKQSDINLEQAQKELEKARLRAKELVDKATIMAKLEKSAIIEDAKKEAKRRIDNVNQEIELEINKQKSALRKEIVDIAFLAAEKIVKREVSRDEHLSVVEDFLTEVGK